jgi:hypothetical protein
MNDAQETVTQHFQKGRLPRLDMTMLPRDKDRAMGSTRAALCSSFNYCRQYPKKLELMIEVLKWVTNFCMAYQHYDNERRESASKQAKAALERKKSIKAVQKSEV